MTTLEVLLKVQALIGDSEHPERWNKGSRGRTAEGKACYGVGSSPVAWCPYGAFDRVVLGARAAGEDTDSVGDIDDIFSPLIGGADFEKFNDAPTTTHADICALIQRAVDAERAREPAQ